MSAIVKYYGLIIGLMAIRVSGRGTWNVSGSYEFYVSPPNENRNSFDRAQEDCKSHDGWLALVKTQPIQDFIESLVSNQGDAGNPYAFYIGLRYTGNKYVWDDGDELSFQYFKDSKTTPDNGKQCVIMKGKGIFTYGAEMEWNNIECKNHGTIIGEVCQRLIGLNWGSWQSWNECTCLGLRQRNRTCADSGRMGPNSCAGGNSVENGTCTPPPKCNVTIPITTTISPPPGRGEWVASGSYEYYVSKPGKGISYDDSQATCKSEDGELALVKSEATQTFIASLVSDQGDEGIPYGFYIGLRYNENDKKHVWTDGSMLVYRPWATGEPNLKDDEELCVAMGEKYTYSADMLWHDYRCVIDKFGKKGFVCQRRIGKYWSDWAAYSGCNCNTNNETRSRTCMDSGREGPNDCIGVSEETKQCPYEPACYTTTASETTPNPTTISTAIATTYVPTTSPETTSAADPVISTSPSDIVTTTIPTTPTTSPKTTSVADSMISTAPLSADVTTMFTTSSTSVETTSMSDLLILTSRSGGGFTTMSTASTKPPKTTSVTDSMISTVPLSADVTTMSTASATPAEITSMSDPLILTSRSGGGFTTMSTASTTPPKTTSVTDSMISTIPLSADVITVSTGGAIPLETTSVSDPLALTSRLGGDFTAMPIASTTLLETTSVSDSLSLTSRLGANVTTMSTGTTKPLKTTSVTDPMTSISSSEEIVAATATFGETSYATDVASLTSPSDTLATAILTSKPAEASFATDPVTSTSSSDIISMTMPTANTTSNVVNSVTNTSLFPAPNQNASTTSTAKINSGATKMQTSPTEVPTAEAQSITVFSSTAQTSGPSVQAEVEIVESTASEPSSTVTTLGNIAGPAPRSQNIIAPVVASIGGLLLVALIIVLTYMVYKRRKMTGSGRITSEVELRRRGSDRQSLTDDTNRIVKEDPRDLEDGLGSNASAINPMFSFLDDDMYASNDKNTAETSSLTHQEDESGPSGVNYAVVNKNRLVQSISSVSSASAEETDPNHVEMNGDIYAVVSKIKPSQPTALGSRGPYAESSTSI